MTPRGLSKRIAATLIAIAALFSGLADAAGAAESARTYYLANEHLVCAVTVASGGLVADTVRLVAARKAEGSGACVFASDADFLLEVVWTGWKAPGFVNNAENPLQLTKRHFRFVRAEDEKLPSGGKLLKLSFRGEEVPFELLLTYAVGPKEFFVRRTLAVRDSAAGGHFLSSIHPERGWFRPVRKVLKTRGFGQPVAALGPAGGFFLGMEYPIATNMMSQKAGDSVFVDCEVELGKTIGSAWLESEPVVIGLSPDPYVELAFSRYLDAIRVAPATPYLLYNSWYDLRAPEMVKDSSRVLNERNCLRAIRLLQQELVEKRGVRLDAFVLDDGWDIYRSDWRLRPEEFPNGFRPLREELRRSGSCLGIWVGPIGGYSHRDWRVGFMSAAGYETVGDQMCVAGQRYSRRLRELVTDFVRVDSVLYFKWDGIQFSCSQPGHGHLPGIYSRRAVMETVIDLCRSVRAVNPSVFTNVTSGTWLSPWWLKYTNTIWMQGADYGYANVPSISRRDRAITYRDYVLYDDLVRQGFWFPVANLMTHGIIKGHLELLGDENEPLEKFTDDALLYVARGPAMWELYISPDLLSQGEWDALAGAIHWAKDRWPLLKETRMVGGDPGARQTYAYVHISGRRGIVAARNPDIETQPLSVPLSAELGLTPGADSLAVVQTYPVVRGIGIFREGGSVELRLSGYETAVYEIVPVDSLPWPVWTGLSYTVDSASPERIALTLLAAEPGTKPALLNPARIEELRWDNGEKVEPASVKIPVAEEAVVPAPLLSKGEKGRRTLTADLLLPAEAEEAVLAFLLEPIGAYAGTDDPRPVLRIDGRTVQPEVEQQKGHWMWLKVPLRPGRRRAELQLQLPNGLRRWEGRVSAWIVAYQRPSGARRLNASMRQGASFWRLPPRPWPSGRLKRTVKLGEVPVQLQW